VQSNVVTTVVCSFGIHCFFDNTSTTCTSACGPSLQSPLQLELEHKPLGIDECADV
jgi:hypothetical protein